MSRFERHLTDHIATATGRDLKAVDLTADELGRIVDKWYVETSRVAADVPNITERLNNIAQHYTRKLLRHFVESLEKVGEKSAAGKSRLFMQQLPERAKMWLLGKAVESLSGKPPEGVTARLPHLRINVPTVSRQAINSLSDDAKKQLMKQALFPPMKRSEVRAIMVQLDLMGKLAPVTQLLDPHTMTNVFSRARSQGKTRVEIIRQELMPRFHLAKSDAARITRNVGSMLTTHTDLIAYQGLGSLLLGYEVSCVTDKNSRPWHQKRKDVIYYLNPKKGQKGVKQMPRPPYEPEDPAERPAGTPELAHNCRCRLLPVTRNLMALKEQDDE